MCNINKYFEVIMKSLIKVNKANKYSVNAKDLHGFLNVKTEFSLWIKRRIKKYDFIENVDYIKVENITNKIAKLDYYLRISMAKELSMVENTDRGKEARRYFIEVEKRYIDKVKRERLLKSPPTNYVEALKEIIKLEESKYKLIEENHKLATYKEENEDVVEFAKDVLNSEDLFTTTVIAQDFGMSAIALNRFLEKKGVIYKQGVNWVLKGKYKKMDLGRNATYTYDSASNPDKKHSTLHLKWTQKGIKFITELIESDNKKLKQLPIGELKDGKN